MTDNLRNEQKLYGDRDIIEQGQAYCDHVMAMTAEGLHAKSDIAAELAHRDLEIARVRTALYDLVCSHNGYRQGAGPCVCAAHENARAVLGIGRDDEKPQGVK